jgi:hypothetical protein
MTMRATKLLAPLAALLVAGLLTATAAARTTAAPQNTSNPTISGQAREGSSLTANNGSWSNTPTSFTYQWQRCNTDGTGCAGISGATSKTYALVAADVDHRMRVVVTATNADGSASANSTPSAIVSSTGAPVNTAKPTISGSATVGEDLTAANGTWSGGVRSFTYQWQRCPSGNESGCTSISGATAKTYTVRTADVGSALRVNVTAHNASGSTATATSDLTSVVGQNTTTVVQTTTKVNHAPTITLLSAKRINGKVYVRFRSCDDSPGKRTILARDTKRGLSDRHVFSVTGCATYARNWRPVKYFRTGAIKVTLRATDKSGKVSRVVSRTIR